MAKLIQRRRTLFDQDDDGKTLTSQVMLRVSYGVHLLEVWRWQPTREGKEVMLYRKWELSEDEAGKISDCMRSRTWRYNLARPDVNWRCRPVGSAFGVGWEYFAYRSTQLVEQLIEVDEEYSHFNYEPYDVRVLLMYTDGSKWEEKVVNLVVREGADADHIEKVARLVATFLYGTTNHIEHMYILEVTNG